MSVRSKLACLGAAVLSLAAGSAYAQTAPYTPTASLNKTFGQYNGVPTTVLGSGNVDVTNFYWLYEKRGTSGGQAVDSWLLFFDPLGSSSVAGSVTFAQSVLQVFGTRADLQNSSSFQRTGYTYNYSVNVAPEAGDTTTFSGKTVNLNWGASDPGDYVRVLTAVPEPATYAQMAAGLWLMGMVVRRRQRAKVAQAASA